MPWTKIDDQYFFNPKVLAPDRVLATAFSSGVEVYTTVSDYPDECGPIVAEMM